MRRIREAIREAMAYVSSDQWITLAVIWGIVALLAVFNLGLRIGIAIGQ